MTRVRAIPTFALLAALTACGGAQREPVPAHDAAPLFNNGGFEAGDLSSWTVSVYWNNGIANYPPQSISDLALQACPSAANADCVNVTTVMTSAATESQQISGPPMGTVSLASPRWPKFGNSSAVVNYGGFRRNVNALTQRYTTTAADVDPSDGTIHARFALSPQLQNPGHPVDQQPYFYVVLRNVTKGTTLYQTFNYSNQAGIPWKSYTPGSPGAPSIPPWKTGNAVDTTAATYATSEILYTDWQVFDVAPGNAALWVGDTIEIEIVAAGCSPAGHWGQVWVDGFGAMLPSLSIAGAARQWVSSDADVTYTFTVENATSLVARNVVATEVLPADTTFVSMVQPTGLTTTTPCSVPAVGATGTGVTGGPSIVCPLGWLNPSTSVTFQVTVHTAPGLANDTVITNGNYSVQGDGIHAILGSKIETRIGDGPYADLGVTVTDGVPAVVPGGSVTYTIVASNFGPTDVSTVAVSDAFPAQLRNVQWTCAAAGGGACSMASGAGSIDPTNGGTVSLPSGATATFTATATVDPTAAGTLANTATVALPRGITDSNPANDADTDLDTIGVLHAVAVSKAPSATGQGQVVSSPVGISCGEACSSQSVRFLDGSQVTLTAIARPGDWFVGWSGACTGSGNVCTLALAGADLSVVASFRGPAVVGSAPGGGGTISCAPSPAVQQTTSTCAVTPSAGYQLVALTDNGADVLAQVSAGAYTIAGAALVNDHAVVATFLKSQGTGCGAGVECVTGFCTDGVCCDGACTGQCQACDQAGSAGACTPVTGAPLGGRPLCTANYPACAGTCDGVTTATCTYPGASTSCAAQACTNGVVSGGAGATCDGQGSCNGAATLCAPYVCDPSTSACFDTCSADGQCQAGHYCSSGACVVQSPNGTACSAADQCASGHCVDGVCCDGACNGQCEACGLPGLAGTCSPVTGAPAAPRAACVTDGTACGGTCDGTHRDTCAYPGDATSCRAGSCGGGVATLGASCNGSGTCPATQSQACSPLTCGATACAGPGACLSDGDCPAGDWCAGGVCVAKLAAGAACGAGGQCGTGHCVDGVCCDTACNGQCEACNVSGHAGACTPVAGAPVGARRACETDGSSCGGTCDGTVGIACTYPGSGASCRGATCAAGVATLAASCDGGGHCPAVQTEACAPNTCSGTICGGGCTVDADCGSTALWCAGGVCAPRLGAGAACGADPQCRTGHCTDGVCCDGACNGQCEACAQPGSVGTCTATTGEPVGGRPACSGEGSTCGGACDGATRSQCTFPSASVECRAPACTDGVSTAAATCDGAGTCPARQRLTCPGSASCSAGVETLGPSCNGATCAPIQTQACAPFVCDPSTPACFASCSADGQCEAGFYCSGGSCLAQQPDGTPCSGAGQCTSGRCVQGACSDASAGYDLAGGGCSTSGGLSLAPLGGLALALALRRRRRGRGAGLAAGLLLLGPAAARADDPKLDVQRFDPLGGTNDVLAVPSARVGGELELHAALLADYGSRPLRLVDRTTGTSTILVEGMTSGTASASLGLFGWSEVSVALPFALGGSGTSPSTVDPGLPSAVPGSGIGDLLVTPKVTLWSGGTLALGLLVPVTVPTGSAPYLSSGSAAVSPRAAVEVGSVRGARVAADVGATLRKTTSYGDVVLGSELVYGIAAELPIAGGRVSALGTLTGAVGGSKDHPLEAIAALRIRGPAGFSFTLGGGPGLSQAYGTPQYRIVAGVEFATARLGSGTEPPGAEPAQAASATPRGSSPDRGAGRQKNAAAAVATVAPTPRPTASEHEPKAVLGDTRIVVSEPVQFVPGRDDLAQGSSQLLDDVAAVLRAHPEIGLVRVEVHTDDDGTAEQLLAMSRRRAAKVRDQLARRGIDGARIDARGYGDTRPLTVNYSERDRAMNRRVEFVVVKKPAAPAQPPK